MIILCVVLTGCSNSELDARRIQVKEENIKVNQIVSSYDNSMEKIKIFETLFVSDLYNNLENKSEIDFSVLADTTTEIDFDLSYSICKSKLLQTAKKSLTKYDFINDIGYVNNYLIENKEVNAFLDSETGIVTHIAYFRFPEGTVIELVTEWYDGFLNSLNIRELK